jgi:mono/diheme cytochrome c family protein
MRSFLFVLLLSAVASAAPPNQILRVAGENHNFSFGGFASPYSELGQSVYGYVPQNLYANSYGYGQSAEQKRLELLEQRILTLERALFGQAVLSPSNQPAQQIPAPLNAGSILATKCARCHGASKGRVPVLDAGIALSGETVRSALDAVNQGKMPKGGPPLTAEEIAQFKDELLAAVE